MFVGGGRTVFALAVSLLGGALMWRPRLLQYRRKRRQPELAIMF